MYRFRGVEHGNFTTPNPEAEGGEVGFFRFKLKTHGRLFRDSPNLHAEIVAGVVHRNIVIDHEHVTGQARGEFTTVAIYEVNGDLIRRVWLLLTSATDAVDNPRPLPRPGAVRFGRKTDVAKAAYVTPLSRPLPTFENASALSARPG